MVRIPDGIDFPHFVCAFLLLLVTRIVVSAHHRQEFSVGLSGHEHPAFRSILHRTIVDGDFIANLERRSRPAAARKEVGTHSLEAIRVSAALIVSYIDPEPDMRIGPVYLV